MDIPRILNRLLLMSALIVLSATAVATNLRGQVNGEHHYSAAAFPMARPKVAIYRRDGKNLVLVASTLTGPNGMYYFHDVAPGNYILVVKGKIRVHITVANQQSQDIGPVLVH